MKIKPLLWTAFVALSGVALGAAAQAPTPLALVGGTLIDGSGSDPVPNSVVLIRGDRIERIGTVDSLPVPDGYEQISTEGMTVMPGLWDLHVHLTFPSHPNNRAWLDNYRDQMGDVVIPASLEQLLTAGVTSVRDLAAPTEAVFTVKNRVANGELLAPTVYVVGAALQWGDTTETRDQVQVVSSLADATAYTTELIEAGADFIKILNAAGFPPDVLAELVDLAHSGGVRVTAHGRGDDEIRAGLAAGVDQFEHIAPRSPEIPTDIVESIRRRIQSGQSLYWTPTIGMQQNFEVASDPEYLQDPNMLLGLTPEMAEDVRTAIANAPPRNPPSPETGPILRRKIQQLRELGVILVAGSDQGAGPMPASQATVRDLMTWVDDFGMDPMTAIRWATLDSAQMMGVADDYGTLTEGKYADVIAVRGNPLRYINVLRFPEIVVKHGRRFK